MEVKLYIGNLATTTTEADLQTLFTKAGKVVSVKMIKNPDTSNPKGAAFVTMTTEAEAKKAISRFDGSYLNERELKVTLAREDRSGGPALRNWGKR